MTGDLSGSITVLHVDDEPDIAELAAEFIERHDERFEVETASSASEGIDRLARNQYDCVVSDFDMPGQDGIEFLQAVREDRPDLPFILYTGKGSEEVASEAISSGVTDYLQKESGTSQYDVLANRIRNAVGQFHTQEELERSQDLLEHTEQLAEVGGWEADVETGEQRWTEGTYAIHDIDPDSDFDPTVDAGVGFYHPDDQDEIERLVERCMQEGEPYDAELRLLTADDRLRWVRATGEPIRDDGDIVTVRGAIRDITERKEREQEITRLSQLHQTILSNIRETVLVTDDDGQFTYICPNVHFIFGYDVQEVADLGTVEAVFDERLIDSDVLERAGERRNIQTTLTDSDGEEHTVLVTVRQIDFEDGTRLYSVRDITERKERERELTQRIQQLQGVLDSVEAAIWIRDLDSRFIHLNQNCRDLFGVPDDEDIVGKRLSDLFAEGIADQFRDNDQQVIATEEQVEIQEEVKTERGVRTYLTRITPLFDDDGELFATCGVASNITAQKERERELKRQNERLDEFVGVVSHDLRTPLKVAEGGLELAAEEGNSGHLDDVSRALTRMEALIEDTLSLARAGRTVGEIEAVELATLMETCWRNVETAAAQFVTETDMVVRADETRLQQLLENLLRNAVEHGGPETTITIGKLSGGFYVEDNGEGIPTDERDSVLEPGYTTREGGTGFGLSIVRDIAQAHGWQIDVTESSEGGARFEFTGVERD